MDHLNRARERLAALSRGGSPDRPIRIGSAAVIEVRAKALACPQCGGEYRLHEHVALGRGLRRVDVACRMCSRPRSLWFQLEPFEPN